MLHRWAPILRRCCVLLLAALLVLAASGPPIGLAVATRERVANDEVVGGRPVPDGKYPFVASVRIAFSDGRARHVCGGSLLAPAKVLSAAHCYEGLDPEDLRVQVLDAETADTVRRALLNLDRAFIASTVVALLGAAFSLALARDRLRALTRLCFGLAIGATVLIAALVLAQGWAAAAVILGCYAFVAALLGGVAWCSDLPLTAPIDRDIR